MSIELQLFSYTSDTHNHYTVRLTVISLFYFFLY